MKPKVSRRKKKTKTKTGINEKKSKITIENSKEIKSWFFKRSTKLTNLYLDSPTKKRYMP